MFLCGHHKQTHTTRTTQCTTFSVCELIMSHTVNIILLDIRNINIHMLARAWGIAWLGRAVAGVVEVPPIDPCVSLQGRYNQSDSGPAVSFDSPGFQIDFGCEGTGSIDILLSVTQNDQPHRFWVYVDGVRDDHNIIDTSDAVPGQS